MKRHFPNSFWDFNRFPFPWEGEKEDWGLTHHEFPSGLSIYEDENFIYIEAALPGMDPEEVDISFDNGILWIRGEREEEEKKEKKFYRKAQTAFSYSVVVPGDIDEHAEPEATFKNGIIQIKFKKTGKKQSKKIRITKK